MVRSFLKFRLVYIVIDILLMALSFGTAYILKYTYYREGSLNVNFEYISGYLSIFFLWAIFIVIIFYMRSLYSTNRGLSIPKEISKTAFAVFYASILIGAVVFFAKYKFLSRQLFLVSTIILWVLLAGVRILRRLILRRLISKGFHNINVLVVGADKLGQTIVDQIKEIPSRGFKVVGFLDDELASSINGIPILGKIRDFPAVAKRFFVDEVIVAMSIYQQAIPELIKHAKRMRLGIRLLPQECEGYNLLNVSYLGLIPFFNYGDNQYYISRFFMKRIFDVLMSAILIIVFSPIFILIAVLIKLDSRGPVLYVQKRMGIKGKIFNFYKFRSMVINADLLKQRLLERNEVRDGIIFKIKSDPRITRIGVFIRKYSLDELPQLFNVLKGDMSLVGPRPFPIEESQQFNYNHKPRLNIRPGITGLPQVKGRSELTFKNWVRWDIWYINNWSLGLDLKILLWTLPVVLKGRGAY